MTEILSPWPPLLLDKSQTASRLGLSVATLDRLRRRPDFPQPVRLGAQRVAFLAAEIEDWILAQRTPGRPR